MSPSLSDILRGCCVALATPPSADQGPQFLHARFGTIALLNWLAAQEIERAPAADRAERAAIEALFADARAQNYRCETATPDSHARRRALIALHEAVEARGDRVLDRRILQLYRQFADARQLDLPAIP